MLKTLSTRNAKRQSKDYLIYFITLVVSASLMFGLNSLIFSKDIYSVLQNTTSMRYMIIVASVIIILILSWLIRYMMNFMLKKRSKELSIYMVLGIENKDVVRMFLTENLVIGAVALLIGYIGGTFVFHVLKAIVMNLIGLEYSLSFDFSIQAIALTALYFTLMYAMSAFGRSKTIRSLKLRDLLYYENQNESPHITKSVKAVLIFCLSLVSLLAGIYLFVKEPLGDGISFPIGILFVAVFIFCFFMSLPHFVVTVLSAGKWRYKGNRALILRDFTYKLNSMSKTAAFLSIVLAISLLLITTGMIAVATFNYRVSLVPFDFSIISENGNGNISQYQDYAHAHFDIQNEYVYNIYQSDIIEFTNLNFGFTSYSYVPVNTGTYDLCMTYSDYSRLRRMLGYSSVSMGDSNYLVHCFSYFYEEIENHAQSNPVLEINGYKLSLSGVYTENFDQYDGFSNGRFFILVVPDFVAADMEVLYTKYSVLTSRPLTYAQYEQLLYEFGTLKGFRDNSNGYTGQTEYLDAKTAVQKSNGVIYSTEVLPVWYVAFILCVTGITVLASNVLSDEAKRKRQFNLFRSIGYSKRSLDNIILSQLAMLFIVPVVPSIILVAFLAPLYAKTFGADVFVPNAELWNSILIAIAVYIAIYVIYFIAAYVIQRRNLLSTSK